MPSGPVLTPNQEQEIITQRLNGIPVRAVARMVNRSPNTVVAVFARYRQETADDRAEELAQIRDGLIARHEDAALEARLAAADANRVGDTAAHARYLREERDSLREVARLTGADLPMRVEVSGQVDVNVSDPRERLTEYLLGLCPSNN